MLAVQEARRLWPDVHIDAVVSLGTGEVLLFQFRMRTCEPSGYGSACSGIDNAVLHEVSRQVMHITLRRTRMAAGELPTVGRERSMSAYFDTGSVLIESATDVFRVDAALATLGELIPGLRYFRSGIRQAPGPSLYRVY